MKSLAGERAVGGESTHFDRLDGLRAISISLVLFCHLTIYGPLPGQFDYLFSESGQLGVTLFFVISGFLITNLLLREERLRGSISLRAFYGRRLFRIVPAYYLCIAVLLLLKAVGLIGSNPLHSFIASALFVRNLVGHGHETAHFWSLSLEEQFYLFWPPLLVILKPSRRLAVCASIIVLVFIWRIVLFENALIDWGALYMRTDVRIDSILIGCALALVRDRGWNTASSMATIASALTVVLWTATIPVNHFAYLGYTFIPLGFAQVVHWSVSPQSGGSTWLSKPLMRWLGRMSYSLYLWQQVFLGPRNELSAVRVLPLDIICVFGAALASYHFVERPFLVLKDRFFAR